MSKGHEAFKNHDSVEYKSRHQRQYSEVGNPLVVIAPFLAAGGVIWMGRNIQARVSEFRSNRKQNLNPKDNKSNSQS